MSVALLADANTTRVTGYLDARLGCVKDHAVVDLRRGSKVGRTCVEKIFSIRVQIYGSLGCLRKDLLFKVGILQETGLRLTEIDCRGQCGNTCDVY